MVRHQWCVERRMWAAEWHEVVFTDESRIYLQHHNGRIRSLIHRGERMPELLRYAPPHWNLHWIWYGVVLISLALLVRMLVLLKQPVLHLRGVGAVVFPALQGMATAIYSTG
ncbi:hypothetical protein TNCV_4571111 [Trichonephila clavipes]|nr:hypothetical protein TNCV_4571111 [Trichonephila clavipes]